MSNNPTTTPSTPAEMAERLPVLLSRIDSRIAGLRQEVASRANSLARDCARIAKAATEEGGLPQTILNGSGPGSLDQAITELRALEEERRMVLYVVNGPEGN